jgi:hypothetical protein
LEECTENSSPLMQNDESENEVEQKLKRNRPNNLKYQKISNILRVNVIYSRKVLNMGFRNIAAEFNVNYNTVRNILKVHEDGETKIHLLNN